MTTSIAEIASSAVYSRYGPQQLPTKSNVSLEQRVLTLLQNAGHQIDTTRPFLWHSGDLNPQSIAIVVIQPNTFCNINCKYCYLSEQDRRQTNKMEFDTLEMILARLFQSKMLHSHLQVLWHASEPLALSIDFYQQAFQLFDQFNKSRIKIQHVFQTNATLLTDEWCVFIKQNNCRISVSIDGPEFIHDFNRVTYNGKGTFKKVLQGISRLRKHNIPFGCLAVLTQEALEFPDEMFEFFRSLNSLGIAFNIEEIENQKLTSSLSNSGQIERFRNFFTRFMELSHRDLQKTLIVREFSHFLETLQHFLHNDNAQPIPLIPSESRAFALVNFDYKGDFSTFSPELLGQKIPGMGDWILGNVFEMGIDAAVNTEKYRNIAQQVGEGIKMCSHECKYFGFCGGGSPSNKIAENGTASSTETLYCKLYYQVLTEVFIDHCQANVKVLEHYTKRKARA